MAMERMPIHTQPSSLKALASGQLCKNLCNGARSDQKSILDKIPNDLEESLCYSMKEYKWDELSNRAVHTVWDHGKQSVLNYSNTTFAGICCNYDDQVLISDARTDAKVACLAARGVPIKMIAWHPLKNLIAVAQKGIWFFDVHGTHTKHCAKPLRVPDTVKKIVWDNQGQRFLAAGSKQLVIFPADFLENTNVHVKYFTFPDTFPHHHYDVLEDVLWTPSGKHILAWQRIGGKRGYLDNKKYNALFVIDIERLGIIRKITIEPTVELHGVIDNVSLLISKFGQLARLNYANDPAFVVPEYDETLLKSYYALWQALHVNQRHMLIGRKNSADDAVELILYDRELKKNFEIPAFFKGLMQLSIDKKLVYGNDNQDDIINVNFLTEQCTLKDLLMHLEQAK